MPPLDADPRILISTAPLPADPRPLLPFLLFAIAVGTLIRVWLAGITDGTNDAVIWYNIATAITDQGLIEAYRSVPDLNHPPLSAIWSWIALHAGIAWFTFVMKIPAIIGDALSVALLGKIWLERGDVRSARAAMIAMAFSPVAILISGFHCNTDSLYAFFSLLAMYLMGMQRNFVLGGLALGAAINVKLVPVILLPAAFALCRSWRQFMNLFITLTICTVPFLPLIVSAPDAVQRNMLTYAPPLNPWGITHILQDINTHPRYEDASLAVVYHYRYVGRYIILGVVAVLCLTQFIARRWNAFELATLIYSTFLVLAPGFGYQYMVILVPMLLAVSISRSWLYGILGMLYLLFMYGAYLQPDAANSQRLRQPFLTVFPPSGTAPGAAFGSLAWWVLAVTSFQIVKGRKQKAEG